MEKTRNNLRHRLNHLALAGIINFQVEHEHNHDHEHSHEHEHEGPKEED